MPECNKSGSSGYVGMYGKGWCMITSELFGKKIKSKGYSWLFRLQESTTSMFNYCSAQIKNKTFLNIILNKSHHGLLAASIV